MSGGLQLQDHGLGFRVLIWAKARHPAHGMQPSDSSQSSLPSFRFKGKSRRGFT